jgi:hypothetical protein
MAKRFIDTGIFDDPWFMDLSLSGKVFWLYCITKCDHAGILELNEKLCQFQTGIKDIQSVIKGLGNRLIMVKEQYYFIPKFLEYQYPNFPNSNVRQQESAIKILSSFGLFNIEEQTLSKGLINSYDNVSVSDSGNESGKGVIRGKCLLRTSGVNVKDVEDAFNKTDDIKNADYKYYFNTAMDWSDSGNNMRVDWIATIRGFARRDLKDEKLRLIFRENKISKRMLDVKEESISETAMNRTEYLEWKKNKDKKQTTQK